MKLIKFTQITLMSFLAVLNACGKRPIGPIGKSDSDPVENSPDSGTVVPEIVASPKSEVKDASELIETQDLQTKKSDLNSTKTQFISSLAQEQARATAEIKIKSSTKDSAQVKVTALSAEIESGKKSLEKLEKTISRVKGNLADATKAAEDVSLSNSDRLKGSKNKINYESALASLESEKKTLQAKLAQQSEQLPKLEQELNAAKNALSTAKNEGTKKEVDMKARVESTTLLLAAIDKFESVRLHSPFRSREFQGIRILTHQGDRPDFTFAGKDFTSSIDMAPLSGKSEVADEIEQAAKIEMVSASLAKFNESIAGLARNAPMNAGFS